jgi:hypothetical protein
MFVNMPKVARALSSPDPTVFRVSLAMRRAGYYGGWCPKAIARYGQRASSYGKPGSDEAKLACEREAVELHTSRAAQIIREIAASLGEKVAVPKGDFESAVKWYDSEEIA